jgi:hypothetical protein
MLYGTALSAASTNSIASAALQDDTTKPEQAISSSLISSLHGSGSRVCSATLNLDYSGLEFFDVVILGWTRRFGMRASKFTDAPKAFVVKPGEEGTPVTDICCKAGIS